MQKVNKSNLCKGIAIVLLWIVMIPAIGLCLFISIDTMTYKTLRDINDNPYVHNDPITGIVCLLLTMVLMYATIILTNKTASND